MAKNKYRAVMFASDGRWVTDYPSESKDEVEEKLADQGSRWFFYPFHAVIVERPITTENQRLVSVAPPLDYMRGITIKRFKKIIRDTPNEDLLRLLGYQ
jgi:hypothetical protein